MKIEPADAAADGTRVEACYQIVADCERLDDVGMPVQSRGRFVTWLTGFADPRHASLAADEAGEPVGCRGRAADLGRQPDC